MRIAELWALVGKDPVRKSAITIKSEANCQDERVGGWSTMAVPM